MHNTIQNCLPQSCEKPCIVQLVLHIVEGCHIRRDKIATCIGTGQVRKQPLPFSSLAAGSEPSRLTKSKKYVISAGKGNTGQ